ncbi:MAG: hypothetical protein IT262_06270 [Saprospiraceae bacterium]|nr:hypothetical protein [Saprospiraceae bacterium]
MNKSQRFEEAMKWWHYIFNPSKFRGNAKDVWQFQPFRETDAENVLEDMMTSLEQNKGDESVSESRNNPFLPHLIARSRTSAYMQWVVMCYLDNLIAWADSRYREETLESINQATQLYVMAGQILGPRPQFVPKRGVIEPRSYMDLADKWDAFSNAMVEMELLFPYSAPVAKPTRFRGNKHSGNAYGFSTALYFCLPSNPKLLGYWDTVADRLFKIRHCLNIEGVLRKLPLFEPPIDPALLVLAASQGFNIGSVLNDLNTPAPNYRFNYLLQKALELTNEVKSLGSALLSALEKKDNEALSLLRAKHESNLYNLTLRAKKLQLEEAEKSLDTLNMSRYPSEYKLKYYQQWVGENVNIPRSNFDYKSIPDKIERVVDESGLKLLSFEKEDLDKSSEAQIEQFNAGTMEQLANIYHMMPSIHANSEPVGVGATVEFGGPMMGNAAQAFAKKYLNKSNELSFQASQASKKSTFFRQLQDRIFQANLAGYELMQIDRQITAQKIRIQLSQQEIANQEAQIEQAKEVEAFLRDKYTNEQLYQWMAEQIKSTYYEVYKMAYDMAKKAEKVYRFEKGLTVSNFIQFGYWNSARDGLLAGEQLYLSLKQLENAYIETKGHDYEISMPVSLLQLNPLALIQLKATGACEFDLPETLFDLAYPGHYKRILKSVAVTIPCLAGPYTSLNCTLRLQRHEFRRSNMAGQSYAKRMDESDERFVYNPVPVTAIAVSQGQNDSGVFELNFRDERFMPFEGAGAISGWSIELPQKFRPFDYDTISDVILHLRYTSREGGETLKQAAVAALTEYVQNAAEWSKTEGLFLYFSLRHQFPNEWHRFVHPEETQAELLIGKLWERLPFFARYQGAKATLHGVRLFAPTGTFGPDPGITLDGSSASIGLKQGAAVEKMEQYAVSDIGQDILAAQKQWKLTSKKLVAEPKDVWMVLQYAIS